MSEWRPIESAPKDERENYSDPLPLPERDYKVLLAFHPDDIGTGQVGICVGYWDAYYSPIGSGYYDGCSPWVISDCGETTDLHYGKRGPTHWMPLPAPPADPKEEV